MERIVKIRILPSSEPIPTILAVEVEVGKVVGVEKRPAFPRIYSTGVLGEAIHGMHFVARFQQPSHNMPTNKSGGARHQNLTHAGNASYKVQKPVAIFREDIRQWIPDRAPDPGPFSNCSHSRHIPASCPGPSRERCAADTRTVRSTPPGIPGPANRTPPRCRPSALHEGIENSPASIWLP